MTREELIIYITEQIQVDQNLLIVLRAIINNTLPNVTTEQLQQLYNILQNQ